MQTETTVTITKEIKVDLGGGVSYCDTRDLEFVADLVGDEDGFEVGDVFMSRKGGFTVEGGNGKPHMKIAKGSPLYLDVCADIAANQDAHDERWQIMIEECGGERFDPVREYGTQDARAL